MAESEHGGGGIGFFAIFFLGLFALWFITGAGENGGLFKTERTEESEPLTGGHQVISAPERTSGRDRDVPTRREIARELEDAYYELERLRDDVREARIWGERSPFADAITLGIGSARATDLDEEHVTLRAKSGNETPIDISGWRLESYVTERGATIPFGARLAYTGRVNKMAPTLLYPGETAIITTGESPIGVSFHENKCTGYFGQFQDFIPTLENSCPRPIDEMEHFTNIKLDNDNCYEFVESLSRCRIVISEGENADPPISNSCRAFVADRLNYRTCVENHRYDPDFERGSWRIYLGLEEDRDRDDDDDPDDLWRSEREIIRLIDTNGKTVDVVEY